MPARRNELPRQIELPGGQRVDRRMVQAAKAELARRRLSEFVRQAWPQIEAVDYRHNWHIDMICRHLEAVADGKIKNLIINVPPGTSKSTICCVMFPAWLWISRPEMRLFFTTYDQKLSTRDSVRTRNILSSEWYQTWFGDRWHFTGDENLKMFFSNSANGWRQASSVGGQATGSHMDILIVDDPHNVQQAESEKKRQGVLDWWDGTMSTRGTSRNVRRIIIMQRLHQEDLAGHILEKEPENWTHICLPMRFEPERMPKSPLGDVDPRSEPGELLWPSLFDEQKVTELESRMGSVRAAGQLQQRPMPMGGRLFKVDRIDIVESAPAAGAFCRYWDKAGTEDGDYSSGVRMMIDADGDIYVEHVKRGQWTPFERNRHIKQTAAADAATTGNMLQIVVEQEGGSGGKESAMISLRELGHYPVYSESPVTNKWARALPFSAAVEAGRVKLVRGDWNQAYLDELEAFPLGKHDDQVDGSSGAYNWLTLQFRQVGQSPGYVPERDEPERLTADNLKNLPTETLELLSDFGIMPE